MAGLVVSGGWLSLAILIGNYGFADLFSLCWHVFLAPFSAWLFCLCSLDRLDILACYARLVCCLCGLASYALCLGMMAVFYATWLAIIPGCLAILTGYAGWLRFLVGYSAWLAKLAGYIF
jgi:hypothetical protein